MQIAGVTPSLVPDYDVTVHIVFDDFESLGRAYRETGEEEGGLEAVIDNFLTGQYSKPVRVIAFNTVEGWARDVSEDIGWELLWRVVKNSKPLPASTREFVEFHVGEEETLRAEAGLT
jgi:hypothetical protein